MGTICVTGTASGIGAATKAKLVAQGHRVIGVDLRDALQLGRMASCRSAHNKMVDSQDANVWLSIL